MGSDVRPYAMPEAKFAFTGWLQSLGQDVINPFAAQEAADRKPYQLVAAGKVGLRIPKTVVTNRPKVAGNFIDQLGGRAIFKGLHGTHWELLETRHFEPRHFSKLESVKLAPVIFQEIIEARSDIRATVIDETVFVVSIDPQHPGARYDWRLDRFAKVKLTLYLNKWKEHSFCSCVARDFAMALSTCD
jgi:glutathione synthase/RimK-type ligase-like ATP-grasp enzyme